MYGILYVPDGGPFAGIEIALWKTYGVPFCFSSVPAANRFMSQQSWILKYEGHAMVWRHVMHATRCMVEVFSGNRQVLAGRMQGRLCDRPDYDRIMNHLPHCRDLLMSE